MPNIWAVLVASLIPMAIGALWYGPLFGKKWLDLTEQTEEDIRAGFNPLKSYGVTFVMALITAFVLAHFLQAFDDAYTLTGWAAGMEGGFWAWLGFVLTISWQNVSFEDKKLGLYGLNMAYNLVVLLIMGAILGVWR